jgi:hypothetical protein
MRRAKDAETVLPRCWDDALRHRAPENATAIEVRDNILNIINRICIDDENYAHA